MNQVLQEFMNLLTLFNGEKNSTFLFFFKNIKKPLKKIERFYVGLQGLEP